jgi:hypothetical protein
MEPKIRRNGKGDNGGARVETPKPVLQEVGRRSQREVM